MAKKPAKQAAEPRRRRRPQVSVTVDGELMERALKLGEKEMPPIRNLARLIDVAFAEFIQRRDSGR